MSDRFTYEAQFSRGQEIKYISHLDMMRTWERLLRRAHLPVAYSEGFNPRPRLAFAAPLAVGVLALAELVELTLTEPLPASAVQQRIAAQCPAGLNVYEVRPVPGDRAALQARMRQAVYEATLPDADPMAVAATVGEFLAQDSVAVHSERQGKEKDFDLRPLVLSLTMGGGATAHLSMQLRHDPQATGRPSDVLQALGLDPLAAVITRQALVLAAA
ncbi:MAG: TIGR03936 family radical SAM-associated protein [Anaerolineae bacterium]